MKVVFRTCSNTLMPLNFSPVANNLHELRFFAKARGFL